MSNPFNLANGFCGFQEKYQKSVSKPLPNPREDPSHVRART
jgi:hypothetical protein